MWLIALIVSSSVMGLTLLTPALPLVQEDLGVSGGAVQQLLTVYLIALAVGQLVYGSASDRIGRRRFYCLALYFMALVEPQPQWPIASRL